MIFYETKSELINRNVVLRCLKMLTKNIVDHFLLYIVLYTVTKSFKK